MAEAGGRKTRRLSVVSRREVTAAIAVRYQGSARNEKASILYEFTQVTGFHRKYAIRVLNQQASTLGAVNLIRRAWVYDQAVQQALIVVWEAADRICAKRLKQIIPVLVGSMERYGHLTLDPEVRVHLLRMSAATMDRLLKAIRE